MNISIIGFGHIGSVIGSVIASKDHHIFGIDKNLSLINSFKDARNPISEPNLQKLITKKINSNFLQLTNSFEPIYKSEVVIITVGTPLSENNSADLKYLSETCIDIEPYIQDGQLIIVKSTIPPGTTREVVYKILSKNKKNIDVVFSPERLAEGNAINEFKTLPIVIGGISRQASNRASKFWKDTIGIETIIVNSVETSELVKLANNAWIDLNIGLANDLARLSDSLEYNIDIIEVINAANTLKKGSSNVNILSPSSGVGGYCLTKDPWFLYALGNNKGIELNTIKAGRISNDEMPRHSAQKIINFFYNKGYKNKDLSKIKIALLGVSFKSNSGDIRFTPVIPFIKFLEEAGFKNISFFDPLITEKDLKQITIKRNTNILDSISEAECIAFMTSHDEIYNLKIEDLASKCREEALVFDGRRYFKPNEIKEIHDFGLYYTGVGR